VSALALPARRPERVAAGLALLVSFSAVAVGLGAARAMTTAYVPVLLERIADRPALIGAVMLVNAAAGFVIPLVTGLWSDRVGRRAPFIVGGVLVAAGGLVAIALGTASSYAMLALAAATVYVGLNAAQTAHRTLVAERFADGERPKATGAQEIAMLAGALVGTVAGGVLIDASPAALFTVGAVVVVLLAVPTLAIRMVRGPSAAAAPEKIAGEGRVALLLRAARTPGAREVLLAQLLWVFAYAALTPFMVLYADNVLGIGSAGAGVVLAMFGVITGGGMLFAARLPSERVRPTLFVGAALLGGGLVAALPASSLAVAAVPFAAAALGAGLVTALGFPYFARFIPGGEAGTYSGVFFSVRAVAATAALPAAGGLVAVTGSYRALLAQGGAALLALIPLRRAEGAAAAAEDRPAKAGRFERAARVGTVPHLGSEGATADSPSIPALGTVPRLRKHRSGTVPSRRVVAVGTVPSRVVAVIPVFRSAELEAVAAGALEHVGEVLLVDDGAPAPIAARADALAAADDRVSVLRMPENGGKGSALVAAFAALRDRPEPPDAILTLDSDGQHPPDRIPAFLEAARDADVVVGHRRGRRQGGMPLVRRAGNALTGAAMTLATRRRMRDTQNGMRLIRVEALAAAPLQPGRFESETRHLKALARSGARIAWVEIPTIYAGEPSSFRAIADSLRVGREVVRGRQPDPLPGPGALVGVLREWWLRLALGVLGIIAIGLMLPRLQATDEAVFRQINGWGDGPEWLYQALDPHSRNYALITLLAFSAAALLTRRVRFALGAAVAVVFAAIFSDVVLEIGQILFDRDRPEEALGAAADRSHDRHWAHIPSYPSGHLMVTAAMVAAASRIAPRLRWPLLGYLVAVGLTRMMFGAHFPLDVVVGGIVGYEVGLFSFALVRAAGLLPAEQPRERPVEPVPQPVGVTR
jgi:dolichol-phosphate mannosyltransferase